MFFLTETTGSSQWYKRGYITVSAGKTTTAIRNNYLKTNHQAECGTHKYPPEHEALGREGLLLYLSQWSHERRERIRKWERVRSKTRWGKERGRDKNAGFPISEQSGLSFLAWARPRTWSLWALSLCNSRRKEGIRVHLDLLLRPSIRLGVINSEEGQQRIKPRKSLKWDHYYCSLQRPALPTSPEAKEAIFLICSSPSPLLGRIDVSDIWNHKLTRGGIKMKKLHFAVGLDDHIWLMAISCCILCWLWLCKNFKLKFQMTGDTENVVLTPRTMRFYRMLPNISLDSISLCILGYLDV